MSKKDIKIFVTYKDKHRIFKSDIITPIQTGRAIADEKFEGMIGDDTGDNISEKNPRYNELSAQYWVWKHYEEIGDPEYIGFMHYRRHFMFDSSIDIGNLKQPLNGLDIYNTDDINMCLSNLSNDNIYKVLKDDIICYAIKPYDVTLMCENDFYMREHYLSTISGSKRIIWNSFKNAINKLYPEMNTLFDEFTYGSRMNCFNMFIMKKNLFFEYSKFCFDILNEIDNDINFTNFNTQELRFLGYIGEYILTLYLMKLEKEHQNIKYLDGLFLNNIDKTLLSNIFNIQNIFSITNSYNHKIIKILGISIKIKNKNRLLQNEIINRNVELEKMLRTLLVKVSELQHEIYLLKGRKNENN